MKKINPDCPCRNTACPRHGICEECRANHHGAGGLTSCERLAAEQAAGKDREGDTA